MTNQERAAMRQALEALEIYGEHAKDCPQYPTYTSPQDYPKCDCGFDEAIATLREALAEQSYDEAHGISSYHLQETEQAEQEPVAWIKRIPEQDHWETTSGDAPPESEGYTPLYAAPARTKDLTDDEIHKCMNGNFYNALDFARAVIAADREKNKCRLNTTS